MKKKIVAIITLMLMLCILSGWYVKFPENGLPDRGISSSLPSNIIYFGNYAGSPVAWYVLSNSGDNLLLISKDIIDGKAFDSEGKSWADSDLRAWLNGDFYDTAFSEAEKAAMLGDDKVTLMTKAQADDTSLFWWDSARVAGYTSYASGKFEDYSYWLKDDFNDAVYTVQGAGGTIYFSDPARRCGVRPMITIAGSAIRMLIHTDPGAPLEGLLMGKGTSPETSYQLMIADAALPSLTVTDYSVSDAGVVKIYCTPSRPLADDEAVFAFFADAGGSDVGYQLGWSSLHSGGYVSFSSLYFPSAGSSVVYEYEVSLAVVRIGDQYQTTSAGPVTKIEESVHNLNFYGVKDGGTYAAGQSLSFTAVGYKTSLASPSGGETRWAPKSWSVGSQSGTWSAAPYTQTFSIAAPGTYTLTVTYMSQYYNPSTSQWGDIGITWTRTAEFTVEALSLTPSHTGVLCTGGSLTLTPNISGGTWTFDSEYLSRSGDTFTALKAGSTTVSYALGGVSADYTVTIQTLTMDSTAPGGTSESAVVYTGGRFTLTPNVDGGEWNWDEEYFSATFNSPATFTALKAGTSTITYTVGGATLSCEVTIRPAQLPPTGQDFLWVYVLGALAALSAAAMLSLRKRVKRA